MSSVDVSGERAAGTPPVRAGEFRLEVVLVPVSDVDRAKEFYGRLGWRLDADIAHGEDFRIVQFTPPGSGVLDPIRHEYRLRPAGVGPEPVSDRPRHRRCA